jgi:hypothetical protein
MLKPCSRVKTPCVLRSRSLTRLLRISSRVCLETLRLRCRSCLTRSTRFSQHSATRSLPSMTRAYSIDFPPKAYSCRHPIFYLIHSLYHILRTQLHRVIGCFEYKHPTMPSNTPGKQGRACDTYIRIWVQVED